MNALKAGCVICDYSIGLMHIESMHEEEMVITDFKENTYKDYLRNFLNPSWLDRQSFCMNGQSKVKLHETLAEPTGLCVTLNFEDIFDHLT